MTFLLLEFQREIRWPNTVAAKQRTSEEIVYSTALDVSALRHMAIVSSEKAEKVVNPPHNPGIKAPRTTGGTEGNDAR